MNLVPQLVPGWPKLAWAASVERGAARIDLWHGSHVEIGDGWCAEAVWAGPFAEADFDATDLVFGTGLRCRGDEAIFVASGTMLDRLWHAERGGRVWVGNSLPALLACAGLALRDDYLDYTPDIQTMRLGLTRYKRTIPAADGDLGVTYYHNLLWDGRRLREVDKPDTTPDLACYADYRAFLADTARRLKANLESPARRHRVVALASVSSGYDSGAAAVIAREAGCRQAVTIVNASSLLPRSDSGAPIARHLGLACREYRHTPRAYRHEESVWAAAGLPAGLNLTIFDFPEPVCLFFTGYRGDTTWCDGALDEEEPFVALDTAGLALCEFRLIAGVLHCPVAFWGSRDVARIQALGALPEMGPWRIGTRYDRPLPRRLLEEAGVPRDLFGRRKEVTSAEASLAWPFLAGSRRRFAAFARERGLYAPPGPALALARRLARLERLIYMNLSGKRRRAPGGFRPRVRLKAQALLFPWANAELRTRCAAALEAAGAPAARGARA